ncbi:hypothetical protein C7974DRAFT_26777 [Boeremia exigua]|uniref:uncharacterized protein n=1 Tax=Boeremia exigua TaxID=749465 RepID=UPI001E8EB529|nr:uncharacterized protein C7974DRAFT_26777 [Boeremia exigua]KAH6644720.1 hypothetical protein C7974DRAFT_26777 [Boeremia exigua]
MNRKAVPRAHGQTELPNWSSNARLLDVEPVGRKETSPQPQNSRLRDFTRHVRLSMPSNIIGKALPWQSPLEQRKVALYKSRRMAALNSLLHVIPLAGAIVLLFFHWTKYWVGGALANVTTLQFAAKAHELFMQASLLDILCYIVRAQALGGYLPLGALTAAAQAPQLSYLWSLNFISAICTPGYSAWRKLTFSLSILTLLLMTAVVGPSSAILLIPRPNMPHTNSVTIRYLKTSEATLFPDHLNNTHYLDFARQAETQGAIPMGTEHSSNGLESRSTSLLVTDLDPTRPDNGDVLRVGLQLDVLEPQTKLHIANWSIGALPTVLSTLQLRNHSSIPNVVNADYRDLMSANANWTLQTTQPVVMVACTTSFNTTGEIAYYRTDGLRYILTEADDLYAELRSDKSKDRSSLWIPMPQDSTSVLGLFQTRTVLKKEYYHVCTVSPFWWTATTSLTPGKSGILAQTDWPERREVMENKTLRPITIDPEGIPSMGTIDINTWSQAHEQRKTVLALFLSALSQLPGQNNAEVKDDTDELGGYIDPDDELGLGESNIDIADNGIPEDLYTGYSQSEVGDTTSSMSFRVDAFIYGLGYGSTQVLFGVSTAVMITYCLITLLYLTYINITGHTSLAWNSATELIMLALQSKDPGDLGHISVGIDSMETFRRSVGIRVNTVIVGDTEAPKPRLELVFEHDTSNDDRVLTKVERNKAY